MADENNSKKRAHPDYSDESEEERNIPVILKRKKPFGLIPPTKKKTSLADALKGFEVIRKPFRHHYSDLPAGHIRILVIKQRKTDDENEPLELELVAEPLGSPVKSYEALSYEWGENFPRQAVIVRDYTVPLSERFNACRNGPGNARTRAREKFRLLVRAACDKRSRRTEEKRWPPTRLVRENLYNALMRFRRRHHDVRLWVDAICINQHNSVEKTEQITHMAEIYNHARHVRIWLGVKTNDTNVAIAFIKELAEIEKLNTTLSQHEILKKWVALANLMRSRWFSRRWVIQEQVVARKASLYCGDEKVDWNDFADAVSLFRRNRDRILKELKNSPEEFSIVLEVFDGLGATAMVRQNTHVLRKDLEGRLLEKNKTLEELVSEFTPFVSSDPRDTIYAVMAIARPHKNDFEIIRPDYEKSLLEVYIDFVGYCINSSASLDILCRHWAPVNTTLRALVPQTNEIGTKIENYVEVETVLPSWIKQLDGSKYGTPDNIFRGRKHGDVFATLKPQYHASRGARVPVKHIFGKKSDAELLQPGAGIKLRETYNGKLTVRGIILGKVRTVSDRISEGVLPRKVIQMGGWQYSQHPNDYTVHELPHQLWRSLVANQSDDSQQGQPPSYYRRSCLYALQRENASGDVNISDLMRHESTPEVVSDYLRKVQDIVRNRKAFLAGKRKELFGLGPETTKARGKDLVCIIYGCSVPVILRRVKGTPKPMGQRMKQRQSMRPKSSAARSATNSRHSLAELSDSSSSDEVTKQRSPSQAPDTEHLEHFQLIGECYVDGRMDGEALSIPEYTQTVRNFILV